MFAISVWGLLTALFLAALIYYARQRIRYLPPQLHMSLPNIPETWKSRWADLPQYLLTASLLLFLLAFIDPHGSKKVDPRSNPSLRTPPTKGLAIYLITDISLSMNENVTINDPNSLPREISKFNLMKEVTRQFIKDHPDDLIGLISFARGANVLAPLTLDHETVLKALNGMKIPTDLNMQGTEIGYAIFKTANLITATKQYLKPNYDLTGAIMILVTDGFQDPHPLDRGRRFRTMDVEEAGEWAKTQGVRLYVVNVDPKLGTEQYLPNRHQMTRVAEGTGGKFYLLNQGESLTKAYTDIDKLEKSKLPPSPEDAKPIEIRTWSLYPYLIALGMICLFMGVALRATILKPFP